MLRLWLILALVLAGLPPLGARAAACPGASSGGIRTPTCCETEPAGTPGPDALALGGQCPMAMASAGCPCHLAPADESPPRPEAPLPRPRPVPEVDLAAPGAMVVAMAAEADPARKRPAPSTRARRHRGHNEIQAFLGIWQT